MRVGIIGCGLMGHKRAGALGDCVLAACTDALIERAETLAKGFPGARALKNWQEILDTSEVDLVIVSTPHNILAKITRGAIAAGKHVLVEKPAALNPGELEGLSEEAEKRGVKVRVGFNHRFHPALQKAREICDSGNIGELLYIRGRYGHGGRIGYDREWRSDPALSGGGELTDQGVHLIDLARWFLGDFAEVQGFASTYFWDMPVEDNGFMLLKTPEKQVAFLHASWTEWKNLFSFEIFGKVGKVEISGLGGSYGVEKLTYYQMVPQMGPPDTVSWEYPRGDQSWDLEFGEFIKDISENRPPNPGLEDARASLLIVEKIYQESRK